MAPSFVCVVYEQCSLGMNGVTGMVRFNEARCDMMQHTRVGGRI